jgi:DNA-binding CsgD family transcriptional regulator
MLLGRMQERREIELALAQARAGTSATLALVGEPGIGKTALLDHAAQQAEDMQLLRARGVESEAEIPFASLLELVRPALSMLERIPRPQAVALEGALALRPSTAQDRFAVGAATLSLLAAYADDRPVAILLDDAHWLDRSSAHALLFAVRRLMADPIAVLVAARENEPSLLDGADLPMMRIEGLTARETATLLDGVGLEAAARLHAATAGNPLALMELRGEVADLALAPEGAPVLVPARIVDAFLRRAGTLDESARRALVLAATSDSGEFSTLERAAARLDVDLGWLSAAEDVGLVSLRPGAVEFRHPLARSAVYAAAPAEHRRAAHQALAAALPDRDIDRRAWHLAAAAVGADERASAALEQAGIRSQARSAYATASSAFERAGRLSADHERTARLLHLAAEMAWLAGLAERATTLLDEGRALTADGNLVTTIDGLAGQITVRRGPVMRGYEMLVAAAERAADERAIELLAEAVAAGYYAGETAEMLGVAERARGRLSADASARARFLAAMATGVAHIVAGDAAVGAVALREAIDLAESESSLRDDLYLLAWLALAPIFLREADTGRWLIDEALDTARARAAVGSLPFLLNLIARDHATTDRWALAETAYREAIDLARESDQRIGLTFGLAGLAWLEARRGREAECRAHADEAIALSPQTGARMHEVWSSAALAELELGLGNAGEAVARLQHHDRLLRELGITDVDLSAGPELVEAHLRLGQVEPAILVADGLLAAARAKGQPWSLARALRCQGLLADDPGAMAAAFDAALGEHERTPDAFETARTRRAYGERLRRARNRVGAREQLRAALAIFEHLGADPWADGTRAELAATGVTARRRNPSTLDDLTPQELQIALALAGGKTTRETAAALFISPKTVEYHLRHVYDKLGIRSRPELARRLIAERA